MSKEKHIVIIGNGISGVTAARHIRKNSNFQITIISGESEYFFSRTALMYVYMGHMKFEHTQPYEPNFWTKNKIDLKKAWVKSIDIDLNELKFEDGSSMQYDELILATGSKPNFFDWKGQDLKGVGGLFSKQDLENMELHTKGIKRGVIVGGGLIGVEMAEMLLSRGIEVTFLVREKLFWGNVLPQKESELVMRHLKQHHVDLYLNEELDEIQGNNEGRVISVKTKTGKRIECGWVGIATGVSPNIEFVKPTSIDTDKGVLVDEFMRTSKSNIYAIGDCAQFRNPVNGRRSIEQVWYTGRIMGETVAQTITGNLTSYQPGNWFNSAKFFDIEYQTYGVVLPVLLDSEANFYWENEHGDICCRIVYDKITKEFKGVNVFGWRWRHEVTDRWLKEKKTIEYVLSHLMDVNFDPEFYKVHAKEIVDSYNKTYNTTILLQKKSWRNILKQL